MTMCEAQGRDWLGSGTHVQIAHPTKVLTKYLIIETPFRHQPFFLQFFVSLALFILLIHHMEKYFYLWCV